MTIRFPAPVLSQARVDDLEEWLQETILAAWWETQPWGDEADREAVQFLIGVLSYPRDTPTWLTAKEGRITHFRPWEESDVDQLRALGLTFHFKAEDARYALHDLYIAYIDENPMLQNAEAATPAES